MREKIIERVLGMCTEALVEGLGLDVYELVQEAARKELEKMSDDDILMLL